MLKYCIRNLASVISQGCEGTKGANCHVLTKRLSVEQTLAKMMENELENDVIAGDKFENRPMVLYSFSYFLLFFSFA